jgi:hypothetical protein
MIEAPSLTSGNAFCTVKFHDVEASLITPSDQASSRASDPRRPRVRCSIPAVRIGGRENGAYRYCEIGCPARFAAPLASREMDRIRDAGQVRVAKDFFLEHPEHRHLLLEMQSEVGSGAGCPNLIVRTLAWTPAHGTRSLRACSTRDHGNCAARPARRGGPVRVPAGCAPRPGPPTPSRCPD